MEEDKDLRHDPSFEERDSPQLWVTIRLPQLLEYVSKCLLFAVWHDVPHLHDMAAIIDLSMDGDEVPYLRDVLGIDLGFQVNKKNNVDFTFINTFKRVSGPISKIEHKALLLFWIYHFFICTSLMAVVAGFAPCVPAILNRS